MTNKKIVITGASGFIGKNLWEYFEARGYSVIACVSNNETNSSTYLIHDILLPNFQFEVLLEKEKPDFLIHCAGGASVSESFLDVQKDFFKNVVVTDFILDSLRKYSPSTKMIFLSSAAVYGNPSELPITLKTPQEPISPYGFHKMLCEINCKKYYQLFGVPITIARIFSVFGPGLKKQILWDIYQKACHTEAITLNGTGNETRDFIYVTDLAKIIYQLLQFSSFDANTINVATGREITIRDLATEFLAKLSVVKPLCFDGDIRPGDPTRWPIELEDSPVFENMVWLPMARGIQNYADWICRST